LLLFSPKYFVFPSQIKKRKIKIYKTVILPIVLYECESWYVTLRGEHRLRVFEKRVLRGYLDLKERMTDSGENCVIINFVPLFFTSYFWVMKSRRIRLGGHVALMGFGELF
jgi:hypothetical protein